MLMTSVKEYSRRDGPREGWFRSRVISSLLCTVVLAGSAHAVEVDVANVRGQVAAGKPTDAFRQQADQLNVRRCANLFSTAGRIATEGSTYGVQVQADRKAPDAHAVQGVAGITYKTQELNGQAAGVVMTAPVGQGCEGQLVRVAPFQKPCSEILGWLPKGSTPVGDLAGVPLYNLGGNQGQAMLVASGKTCVVVTVARVTGAS